MRTLMPSLVVCTSLFFSFGCGRRDTSAPAAADDRFERRFIEVVGIRDQGKRQEALAQIATEAAEAGNTANTWKALGWMKDPGGRDAVARSCALQLAALGKRYDASLIASHQINNADLKDKTLAEIVKSKRDE
jgi:hypothetical protein